MRLSALLAVLSAFILDQALAEADAKRGDEVVLLSPERLDNVGLATGRPACPPPGCTFETSKLCWDGTYDICTNYYTAGPRTANVVKYYLVISNTTSVAPDGIFRPNTLAINGTIPGPTITANWGDTVEITVRNAMPDNGTSIHWHGIRQHYNFINDGVNGVTECPIAPGQEKTYTWIAEQYGNSWYHSHHTVQYGDGVYGAINIHGPTTVEWDIDLGPVTLSDWFYQTAFQAMQQDERGNLPTADNFLVQGVNLNNVSGSANPGTQYKLVFQPGKKHLLRFINTSTQTYFRVSLDNHYMTVVQTDFVPVVPYVTDTLGIAIGQRYTVMIEANQANATYWLRTYPQTSCSGNNANDGTGIASAYVRYEPAPDILPISTSLTNQNNCDDEFLDLIEPFVLVDLDATNFNSSDTATMNVSAPFLYNLTTDDQVYRWHIGHMDTPAGMEVSWGDPAIKQLLQNMTETRAARSGDASYSCQQALDALPKTLDSYCIEGDKATSYWIVQNQFAAVHPLHLHNHDYNIVARGYGNYSFNATTFNWKNPPRRDVTSLPAMGYVVIVFKADNPSISIFHCHMAWHVAEGLSLQLVERPSEIPTFTNLSAEWNNTCTAWNNWYPKDDNWGNNTDSGLR